MKEKFHLCAVTNETHMSKVTKGQSEAILWEKGEARAERHQKSDIRFSKAWIYPLSGLVFIGLWILLDNMTGQVYRPQILSCCTILAALLFFKSADPSKPSRR